jgi:acyl dehydratase
LAWAGDGSLESLGGSERRDGGGEEGWRGRFYEDFEVGEVYRHPLERTVTMTDNDWFTLLTLNTATNVVR